MATIDSLPPEILIEVMTECDLNDIATLIKSSPLFLHLFSVHREHLLQSVVNVLTLDYPDCEPHLSLCMSTLASRTRCQKRLDATTEEAEAVNDHLFQYRDSELDLSTSTDLSILRNLSRLHSQAKFIARSCALKSWDKICHQNQLTIERLNAPEFLYQTERWRFVQSAIHYDAFCQMFFLNGQVIFDGDRSKREQFFEESKSAGIGAQNIYSIAHFIFERYERIFWRAVGILRRWENWENSRKEKKTADSHSNPKLGCRQGKMKVFARIKNKIHQMRNHVVESPECHHTEGPECHDADETPPSPAAEANARLWQMYSRFKQRTEEERYKFILFLTSQGLGMICKVRRMDYLKRTGFILETFYKLNKDKEVVDDSPYWIGRGSPWEPWRGTECDPGLSLQFAYECWDKGRFPEHLRSRYLWEYS